ncbi:MAG: glycosyltransferase [Clostridia bacterium]|nr:glycosyltransferase [Clostridia bacterium]
MKKIIIVNNDMRVGGVQKSLYNLLWSIDLEKCYDVTLFLFRKTGAYADKLPEGVKVIECDGLFRYSGMSQQECNGNLKDTLLRGFIAAIAFFFGRRAAVRFMLIGQPMLSESYDYAISFLHNGRCNSIYGCVQDFVLSRIKAQKKIAFIHCDYRNCGANHTVNNRMIEQFDKIVACSDGCRKAFESVLPDLKNKCTTVCNCHNFNEIRSLAEENTYIYDSKYINIILVARLSREKGIERALKAVSEAVNKGFLVKLHVVGGGNLCNELIDLSRDLGIADNVEFYGRQDNPYRYMKNADLLLLTSYHEAAPMVIDESRCLGVPILTTETTSSRDMVTDKGCGWVCGNSQEDLNKALLDILADKESLHGLKKKLKAIEASNDTAIEQFNSLFK